MASQELILSPVNWSPEVAASLAKATAPDCEQVAEEVKGSISQCWKVHGYGYLITRLEVYSNEKVLVIVAGQGKGLNDVVPVFLAIAKANNAQTIRIHSKRAGMVRKLEKLGYTVEYGLKENIFYKQVA